jgi:hypothetical protein
MKNLKTIFAFIYFLFSPLLLVAQSDIAICKIATVARYTSVGVELRWIPDNKTILRLGFNNSFSIERSLTGANKFEKLGSVKAAPQETWESLISSERNAQTKSNLELAGDFLFAENDVDQKRMSLDEGIGELNERKSKEDMTYAVFVMTAIKDAKVAEALGLGFIDKTVTEGSSYTYRIKLNGQSAIYKIEDGIVTQKAIVSPDKYKNEVFVYPGDKRLSFAWASKPELAGYYVERAAEGETNFRPMNTTPFYASSGSGFDGPTNGSFMDDSVVNYRWYRYRFYGNTAFGERILFAEVKGMPRDLTPPNSPIIKQPKHIKEKEVKVEWDIYGDVSDLKGFIVGRSDKDRGDFQILHKALLSPKSRSYIDTTFIADGINYYIVYAIDTSGNLSSSYPGYVALIDSTPPAKPTIVSAIIDSQGIVTLTIKLGKEKDLKGYKLFKSNSPDHEFSVIEEAFKKDKEDTNKIKVVFTDTVTLQSLTPKIYYRLRALDYNYNQSEFSDIIAVTRPDTIPPVTPVFTDVTVGEKQIELRFVPSESKDVKEHILYRKTDLTANWEILLKFDSLQTTVVDTNVKTGITYYYSMRAIDEGKLFSGFAHIVQGKPYDSGVRPLVENITHKIENKNVVLSWGYPNLYKDVIFIVYKKDDSGRLIQYKRTSERKFIDMHSMKENVYTIKATTPDGGQSKMSELVIQKME